MAEIKHSRSYERYKAWYKRGAISDELLQKLVDVRLLRQDEADEIKADGDRTNG